VPIGHNDEALSPGVFDKIVAVGGSAQRDGESEIDGFFLSDEAVDWIEATIRTVCATSCQRLKSLGASAPP
jgi:hypothetical protein